MTKREFENFIKQSISELPLHRQEEILNKIQYDWAPELTTKFKEKVAKKNLKCKVCGKYSPYKEFLTVYETITDKDVIVYTDCGYGDDDEIADVTYHVSYYLCPICHKKFEQDRYWLSETNKRKRK